MNGDYMVIGTSALPQTEIDGAVNIYAGYYNNPFLVWGKPSGVGSVHLGVVELEGDGRRPRRPVFGEPPGGNPGLEPVTNPNFPLRFLKKRIYWKQ